MRKHLIASLVKRARTNPKIFLLIGDLGFGVIEDFAQNFPERFLNFGVAEQVGMGVAAGLAKSHQPVFYSIGNFASFRCLEQIRNDVAHENNPVLIVSLGAGFAYGTAGYSHHAIEDASAVASIAGIRVLTPGCIHELDEAMDAFFESPQPIYLRIGSKEECDECIQGSGLGAREKGHGPSNLVIAHGEIAKVMTEVAAEMPDSFTLISQPEFNYFNDEFLDYVASFRRVLTVEEHYLKGGFGFGLRGHLSSQWFDKFEMVGIQRFDSHVGGSRDYHLKRVGLDRATLRSRVLEAFFT